MIIKRLNSFANEKTKAPIILYGGGEQILGRQYYTNITYFLLK